MGDQGAEEDLAEMALHIESLMRDSLERKTRRPLRGQMSIHHAISKTR